jgi:hypothetical protein
LAKTGKEIPGHGLGSDPLRDLLGISLKEMIFIGDALFVGGNDYPAEEAGVVSIPVRGPNETKRVTEAIIACLDHDQHLWRWGRS